MSAIHYKFSSSNEYKNITFDGITISLLDLKRAVMEKQKLKSTELDLHITNAQTLQVYKDESTLIPKNTAVLVRRIPLGPVRDSKVYIVKRHDSSSQAVHTSTKVVQEPEAQPKLSFDELTKASNLAEANASEEDKIKAAIHQSTNEYDPSNFYRPPKYGSYKYNVSSTSTASTAATPSYVRCYRCNQHGHYSMHCPLPKTEVEKVKTMRLATGIPRSHMVEVNKEAKGAMLTSDGRYVVPVMDKKGYDIGKKEKPPFIPETVKPVEEEEEDEPIPDELICLLCKDLLVDAVVIPCCGNSYCDDCIRNALLDSETHQCPTCHKENISPDSLIANKFLRQAVNKFKNDTGIAKKKSNAPVWPRPAPSDKPKTKPTSAPPTKVSYGPPQSRTESRLPGHLGAYVVKAKTEQIVSRPYTVAKRQMEGGSSPHDPTQPIRIKLAPNENSSDKVETTPGLKEPNAQSTPIDAQTLPSTTPQSDSYTFNSTPDTGEEKPKPVPVEPLPPGISPPTAKVVRSLIENAIKMEPATTTASSLTGIHPLSESHPPKSSSPALLTTADSGSYTPEDNSSLNSTSQYNEPEGPEAVNSSVSNITSMGQDQAAQNALTPNDNLADSQGSSQSAVASLPSMPPALEVKPVQVNPPNSEGLGLLGTAPSSALSTVVLSDSKRPSANVSPALQPPVSRPPLQQPQAPTPLPTPAPNLTKPPPVPMSLPPPPLIPPVLPPGLANIPPPNIPTSGVNIFQHPPPPFPFNLLLPPPSTSQPPPGFPPGLAIPSLGSAPPPGLPLPPGTETKSVGFQPISSSSRQTDHHSRLPPARHVRSPVKKRSSTRSPRRRQDRGSRKSKLDIMSDEFAEKMSKKRTSDRKRGRRRSRSRSASVTSGSSYSSSSYSSSRSSSSYSSYTGSSWSSSSFSESVSRSPSPRHRRKNKAKKNRGRRRSKSWSSPVKNKSKPRRRRSVTPKRNDSRRRRRSASKERKRNRSSFTPPPTRRDRRRSPRRGARDRSRTPPQQPNMRPSRRDVPGQGFPAIPVISTNQAQLIPGLPSKEQADYERDQALYAHYRQAYERDWYERGIMPPPPYNRFIQPRFSRSPSPPGTGNRILPPPGTEPVAPDSWNTQNRLITPSGLPASELYELQSHILREEQYYDDVQARLRAMAGGGYVEQPPPDAQDDRRRRGPRRRYDEDRGAPSGRQRDGRRDSRDRYSGSRSRDDRRGGRRDRDDVKDSKHRGVESKNRRENELVEGDATPVRDERPPPSVEEELAKKAEEKAAPRRAGDNVKMGKVSTMRRGRSDKQTVSNQADKSSSRSESKNRQQKDSDLNVKEAKTESRTSKQDSRKNDRKSDSRRSDQRKANEKEKPRDSHTERNETKKSHQTRTDSQSRKSHRDSPSEKNDKPKERKEQSARGGKKSEREQSRRSKRDVSNTERLSSPKDVALKKQKEKAKSPVPQPVSEEKPKVQEIESPTEKTESSEKNIPDDPTETPTVENKLLPEAAQASAEVLGGDVNSNSRWKPVTEVVSGQNSVETFEKQEVAPSTQNDEVQKGDDDRPSLENADLRKVVPESLPESKYEKELSPEPVVTEQHNNEIPKEVSVNNEAPAKSKKSSKRKNEKKHKKSESSKRKKRADVAEKKDAERVRLEEEKKAVIEYDGSAPPPTGDELIKITIPKSRWEESDDETKPQTQNSEEKQQMKPATKGRRIKIKRKPPVENVADETKTASDDKSPARKVKEKSDTEAKKPPQNDVPTTENHDAASKSDKVVDARMVITLRRNSKREEDTRPRRVSLEGPPGDGIKESSVHEDPSSKDKSVIALKGKSIKVTAMRSSRRESEDFVNDDVLDLSHPSGLSDLASESEQVKQKAAKKKKKKKKKHKSRHGTTDEPADTASDRRPTKESDDLTPEPQRKFVIKNEFYSDNEEYEPKKSRSGRKLERKESKRSSTGKRHHDSSRDHSQRRERKRHRRERSESESEYESEQERERTKRESRREGRHKHDKRHKRRHRRRREDYESFGSSYDDEVDHKRSRRSVS
uniref:E3 ubiquitin-protein ligase RBBP6 n=1 Tax=Phallusia mammillata TaxID=59560 RepID=A0A6F9DPU0_9ASCI|nr:E3 ubiquitin-protein ligase RBBP6 [Phallusia mammillata]